MTWFIHDYVSNMIPLDDAVERDVHVVAVFEELERLNKQRCGYCDGFGHSGKDCPTDAKLSHLTGGIAAQSRIIARARKAAKR